MGAKSIDICRDQAGTEHIGSVCCGCGVCVEICPQHAVSIEKNARGFYAAKTDRNKCTDCGKCEKLCPLKEKELGNGRRYANREYEAYALQIKDRLERMASQSGGAYGVFAEDVLSAGGVLYGVVSERNGAVYKRIESTNKWQKLHGSKYVQAFLGNTILSQIREDLIVGRDVLFSGTPCYVDALKRYLNIMNTNTARLCTIDLICHGVPSPQIFEEYIESLSMKHQTEIKDFNFRDNVWGWGFYVCSYQAGRRKYFSENFINIFYSHLCLNEPCYVCPYADINRVGDITVGDCWGIEELCPELYDAVGTSMVLVNTEKGDAFLRKVEEKVILQKIKIDFIRQSNLCMPTARPSDYDSFWQLYQKEGFLKAAVQYCNYRENESVSIGKPGWISYRRLIDYLLEHEVHSLFLYGIGLTMWRMIYHIENEGNGEIQIKGLLDQDKAYVGRTFMGFPVCDEQELPEDNCVIVICSAKPNVIAAIEARLKTDEKYAAARLVHLNMAEVKGE